MRPVLKRSAKLSCVIRYGAFAAFVSWSLIAIVTHATARWLGECTVALTALDDWLAPAGTLIESVAGPVTAIIWLLGLLAILGLSELASSPTS